MNSTIIVQLLGKCWTDVEQSVKTALVSFNIFESKLLKC